MSDEKKKPILKNLRSLRDAAGLSQTQLAVKAGLSSPMVISRLETSFTRSPSLATVVGIAKALGVKIDTLL